MSNQTDQIKAWPGLVGILAATVYCQFFLHAEKQVAVIALLVGGAVALGLFAKLGLLKAVDSSIVSNQKVAGLFVIMAVVVLGAASFKAHYALLMLTTMLLYATVCLGLNVQFGYCGVVNFAGAAFFGVGSYTAAVLSTRTAIPHLLIIACGGLISTVIGSLLILPVLRTRGHYAALITIAFGLLFKTFLEVNDTLGGPQGLKMPGISILGWKLNNNIEIGTLEISFYANYLLLALILCSATFVLVKRLERSWIGLSMDIVRLDEIAASTCGINVGRWKIVAFTIGNFFAGIAGSVYGMMTGFVAPNNFTFGDSLIFVSIIILGGLGNPWGILPAVFIVFLVPEKLQFIQEYRFLLYASLVILILLFRPDGILPRRIRDYFPGRSRI
jgi:ABC-type branched-subunit amino acid transport system permease subunit